MAKRELKKCVSACRYIVGTLDLMVSENYLLVYLCAMAPRNKLPAIKWLHRCYLSIDRRYERFTHGHSPEGRSSCHCFFLNVYGALSWRQRSH